MYKYANVVLVYTYCAYVTVLLFIMAKTSHRINTHIRVRAAVKRNSQLRQVSEERNETQKSHSHRKQLANDACIQRCCSHMLAKASLKNRLHSFLKLVGRRRRGQSSTTTTTTSIATTMKPVWMLTSSGIALTHCSSGQCALFLFSLLHINKTHIHWFGS